MSGEREREREKTKEIFDLTKLSQVVRAYGVCYEQRSSGRAPKRVRQREKVEEAGIMRAEYLAFGSSSSSWSASSGVGARARERNVEKTKVRGRKEKRRRRRKNNVTGRDRIRQMAEANRRFKKQFGQQQQRAGASQAVRKQKS